MAARQLTHLIYELLDAHDDTARLATGEAPPGWQLHLGYLRDLQRVGREMLAQEEGRSRRHDMRPQWPLE